MLVKLCQNLQAIKKDEHITFISWEKSHPNEYHKKSIKRLKIDSKVFTVDAKMDNSSACMLNKSHSLKFLV